MGIYGSYARILIETQNKILKESKLANINTDNDYGMESKNVASRNNDLEKEKAEKERKEQEARNLAQYRKENNMETVAERMARKNKEEYIKQAFEKIKDKANWRIE